MQPLFTSLHTHQPMQMRLLPLQQPLPLLLLSLPLAIHAPQACELRQGSRGRGRQLICISWHCRQPPQY